ncbi:leucine-rich repeat and fibronectin type-III domain-containing protein 5 [Caerostris extrusa]|uniref:Leucine-rich repeat and fibronectin type-III domain-containing protein 5 n=1 Tax=Caerostris extrusa TaxID=172846 RepID=A0AAV4XR49_CAEEX|nr:leucine-rich repeat and fibronectin type-III domain-containing protein 5 [Caerostris extrusa]
MAIVPTEESGPHAFRQLYRKTKNHQNVRTGWGGMPSSGVEQKLKKINYLGQGGQPQWFLQRKFQKIVDQKRTSNLLTLSNPHIQFMMEKVLFTVILLSLLTQNVFSMSCHAKCQCIWRKGKQTAECSSAGFEKIPPGLESTIQVLDLTRNNFTLLPPNSFLNVGLVNLQKLYLARCGIEHIDDFALNRISNLVELDLSDNLISYIPTAAFRHLPLLRHLILSGNPLVIVPTQAFVELKTLIILEISNCKIDTIATRAFEGLEKLEVLKLDTNELQTLHAKTMISFKFLHGITLDGNPWTCDCELRGLRQWLNDNNVPYIPPACYRPVRLRDKNMDRSWH